ncbi:hypothetical protein FQA47_010284 [Oryzias melastigma]|uniref:Uncharacterized protein n=1 Tax=Oryzias melastigma TaxID=30732 RepID=A0A834C641_ORYME|nr:hypothetical protein FQA47_010284 [Oryzias melastigma]
MNPWLRPEPTQLLQGILALSILRNCGPLSLPHFPEQHCHPAPIPTSPRALKVAYAVGALAKATCDCMFKPNETNIAGEKALQLKMAAGRFMRMDLQKTMEKS